MPMTFKEAWATLREIGISLRRTGWGRELRVNRRTGRYTFTSRLRGLRAQGTCQDTAGAT